MHFHLAPICGDVNIYWALSGAARHLRAFLRKAADRRQNLRAPGGEKMAALGRAKLLDEVESHALLMGDDGPAAMFRRNKDLGQSGSRLRPKRDPRTAWRQPPR